MKIDLEEIKHIAESLRNSGDEIIPQGWKAKRIADALEALPKLAESLQYSNRMLIQASKRFGDDEFYDRTFIEQALEPFTTKPQP